jgi:hypothetical protein
LDGRVPLVKAAGVAPVGQVTQSVVTGSAGRSASGGEALAAQDLE